MSRNAGPKRLTSPDLRTGTEPDSVHLLHSNDACLDNWRNSLKEFIVTKHERPTRKTHAEIRFEVNARQRHAGLPRLGMCQARRYEFSRVVHGLLVRHSSVSGPSMQHCRNRPRERIRNQLTTRPVSSILVVQSSILVYMEVVSCSYPEAAV